MKLTTACTNVGFQKLVKCYGTKRDVEQHSAELTCSKSAISLSFILFSKQDELIQFTDSLCGELFFKLNKKLLSVIIDFA